MKLKLPERRRYTRVAVPLKIEIKSGGKVEKATTKNISPVGMRFEIGGKLDETKPLDMTLYLPKTDEPVRIKGKLVWQTKTSLEDNAPYDVGVEIADIEDEDKNIFLKYVCNILYNSSEYEVRE